MFVAGFHAASLTRRAGCLARMVWRFYQAGNLSPGSQVPYGDSLSSGIG